MPVSNYIQLYDSERTICRIHGEKKQYLLVVKSATTKSALIHVNFEAVQLTA